MKKKIKNFFAFLKSAWVSGPRGKWGILLMIISLFLFVRLICVTRNIQVFVIKAWHLNRDRAELSIAEKKLKQIKHHNDLLKEPYSSTDYIEEIGLQKLNLGDKEFKELKY